MITRYQYFLVTAIAFAGSLCMAQQSYEEMVRGYRTKLAEIDDALLKIPLNKSDLITKSHAQLLKSYRAVRAELDTLAKKLNAVAASTAVQSMIDDLLEGIVEPNEKKSSGIERLLAARSRLYAEAESIRKVQDRLLTAYGKPLASHKKIFDTLIDTIGNGLILIINSVLNNQIDPLINKSR